MTVAGRDELPAMGAAEIARRIAAGDLSCGQVVEAHIQSIELVNPRLGALAVPLFERARDEALAADVARDRGVPLGRLHGVPFTVKEFFAAAGTATTLGIPGWSGRVASADSPRYPADLPRAGCDPAPFGLVSRAGRTATGGPDLSRRPPAPALAGRVLAFDRG